MWPKQFEYTRAASVQEAANIIAQNSNAKILAGGHSLLPALKLRLNEPALLVDIGRVDGLKSISANGSLKIGALATHAEIAASGAGAVAVSCPFCLIMLGDGLAAARPEMRVRDISDLLAERVLGAEGGRGQGTGERGEGMTNDE